MSRLEPNGEPSMEEILASIRKIIAEEPTGARASPAPGRASAASPAPQKSGFLSREAFLRDSRPNSDLEPEPAPLPIAPAAPVQSTKEKDPFDRPLPAGTASANPAPGGINLPFGNAASAAATSDAPQSAPAQNGRAEPYFPRLNEASPAPSPVGTVAPAAPAESKSSAIEDQLNDLLSDAAPAAATSEPVKASEPLAPKAVTAPENDDPFSFELGPSPFAARTEDVPAPSPAYLTAKSEAMDWASRNEPKSQSKPEVAPEPVIVAEPAPALVVEPVRIAQPAQASAPILKVEPAPLETPQPAKKEEPAQIAAASTAPLSPAPVSPAPFAFPSISTLGNSAPASNLSSSFSLPSVSATIGPATSNAPAAPVTPPAAQIPTATVSATPIYDRATRSYDSGERLSASLSRLQADADDSFRRAIAPPTNAPRTEAAKIQPVSVTATVPAETPAPTPSLPARTGDNSQREMEDAVADLLRPMLRTWLAENMPRIVERALRREMLEKLNPGQKNAAE